MLKTIKSSERYIFSGTSTSKRKNLNDMKKLMASLGNPEDALKYIHIAGSNGKGSSAKLLSTILVNSGYKVGLYTSPHLVKVNERIKINNVDISDKDFIKYTNIVKKKIDELKIEYNAFDIFTAIMFLYFKDNNVDIVVMEVGLGGRLDSTSIISKPLVSVITTLSLEHTSVLGRTIEKIAKEKAGIIKRNSVTVYYPGCSSTNKVIEDIAKKENNKVIKVDFKHIKRNKTSFDFEDYKNMKLNLPGDYQIFNSCLVLKVIDELSNQGFKIKNIKKSFKEVLWPGRLEVISKKPLIILDGSHNPQGIKTIIPEIKKYKDITIVIGMYKEKDYKKTIDELLPYCNDFICIRPNNVRALDPNVLHKYIEKNGRKSMVFDDLMKMFSFISKNKTNTIIIGSLRLVGDIKKVIE